MLAYAVKESPSPSVTHPSAVLLTIPARNLHLALCCPSHFSHNTPVLSILLPRQLSPIHFTFPPRCLILFCPDRSITYWLVCAHHCWHYSLCALRMYPEWSPQDADSVTPLTFSGGLLFLCYTPSLNTINHLFTAQLLLNPPTPSLIDI